MMLRFSIALAYVGFFAVAQEAPVAPFACNRLALDTTARQRHFEILSPALRSMHRKVRELPDGYEFEFPADPAAVQKVAEWAAGERLCCPFFDIELRFPHGDGALWLRLSGRRGTKEFIQSDFATWFRH